jgi:hypothetical protein
LVVMSFVFMVCVEFDGMVRRQSTCYSTVCGVQS